MRRDVTHSAPGGSPMHLGIFSHTRWPLLWLAVVLGGLLLLALVSARMVNAADEGISLSETEINAKDSDETVTYTVALTGDTAPDGNVTVAITTDNDAVGIDTDPDTADAQTAPLTFTPMNYMAAQTVTLMVKDADTESEGATITHTSSGSGDFDELTTTLRVEVTDDDVAGVTLSSGTDPDDFDPSTAPIKLTEGGTAGTYSVVLSNQPSGEVTVDISSDNTDVTVQPAMLAFTDQNWDETQGHTVTVTVAADASTDNETATLTHDVKSTADTNFDAVADVTVMVEVADDDSAGVTITATDLVASGLNEAGDRGTYTVVLVGQPTANVSVIISSDNADVSAYGPDLPSTNVLTFTSSDYLSPQTVQVQVGSDADMDDEKAKLSHTVASSDANFTNAAIIKAAGDVAVAGEAEDATDEVKKMARDAAEKTAREAFEVTFDITDTSVGVKLSESELKLDEGGAAGSYTVVLRSEPSGDVTVAISVDGSEDVTLGQADQNTGVLTLTFNDQNWETPQDVAVNVATDTSADDESATLKHEIASDDDAAYNALGDLRVAVAVNDAQQADITITDQVIAVGEGDADGATYTVALDTDAEPLKDVTVTITSDNTDVTVDTDAVMDGNQNVLTFTPENHGDAQTVTVSAGMDTDNMDESAKLSHALASEDSNYTNAAIIAAAGDAGVATAEAALQNDMELSEEAEAKARADAEKAKAAEFEVTVNVADNNLGVRISETEIELVETETDVEGMYTVVLQVEPKHNVVVAIKSDDDSVTLDGADADTGVLTLTFTDQNWNQAQTVTVTTPADDDNAHESATITHVVTSNDLRYDGLATDSVMVSVKDDEPRIAISATELEIAEPVEGEDGTVAGGSGSFTVKLDAQPDADPAQDPVAMVSVAISSDNDDVTLSTTDDMDMAVEADEMGVLTLTFTPDDWDTEQTVMVAVAADEDTRDEIANLTLTVTGAESDLYTEDGFSETVTVLISEAPEIVEVEVPGPTVTVTVPGPSSTKTVTETVTVEVPAAANVVGGTSAATATEVNGQVVITRHDGGPSLVVNIGGVIRDESLGQTYQVVRRADGAIVRQWVSPNSPLVYQIPWAVVISQFNVPVGVVGAIPLDDQSGAPGQLVRRFDGGDDRIFSYDAGAGNWRHVPDIPTFQALGLYWCDVTAADAGFFDRITIGPAHPATDMPARDDYPNCSTG